MKLKKVSAAAVAVALIGATGTPAFAAGFTATAKVNVTKRSSPVVNSTNSIGIFVGGQSAPSNYATSGGSYNACGGTSSTWVLLYLTPQAYVAKNCVTVKAN